MKKIFFYFVISGLFLALSAVVSFARTESSNYIIWADVFAVGGSEGSASTNYQIQDSLGEGLAWSATTTSSNYGAKAGFREMYPDQYLTFTAGAASVDLGTLSASSVQTASHTLIIDTNAVKGFTMTVSGSTLTSGANTISAIGAAAASSSAGSEQFGINLVANASPSVGADPTGTSPIGSAAGEYDTADQFAFNSGDTVASVSNDINETTYTVSYIANISGSTESGTYTTTLTYAVTANF